MVKGISRKRKFNGEVFTLRDLGGHGTTKKDANEIASFIRSLGEKKVRVVIVKAYGLKRYLVYERKK